jgi:tetratricopeptide (TPR) repeat protein
LKPQDLFFYFNRGFAYFKKGMYDSAISDCNKAIELDPENTVTRKNLKVIQDKKNSSQK